MAIIIAPKHSLEKRNGLYFMRYRWNGTKPRIALGVGNEQEAEAEAKQWMKKWVEEETARVAAAEAKAQVVAQEKARHPVQEWIGRYLQSEFRAKRLNPKTTADADRNLKTLIRLSKIEYLEDFTREIVNDTLAAAISEIVPKKKFSRKETVSGWSIYALVKSWKRWFKWLGDEELVPIRVWNKLSAPMPKPEDKQTELWFLTEYQAIQALATPLDQELYHVLRFMGIDPADIKEMQRGHFRKDGKKWRFIKERAKKAENKTGTYSQFVDDRALAVLLPRIKIDDDPNRPIFPELESYKDTDSFVSSFGNRNDDYWDMYTFKCSKEELTEVRKGKDYKKLIAQLPVKTIQRKVADKKTGLTYISDRTFNGGAKSLPNCTAYVKKQRIKLLHSLRYTYATAKSETGMPLNELRPAMGHAKDSRVLERFYDHPRSEDEQLENPLE
jgi:hypothetical protein